MKANHLLILLSVIIISSLLIVGKVYASGEMMIAPTRVVFEGSTRSAKVSLVNSSNETKTYRISFVRKRMTEDGGIVDVDKAQKGELFSDGIVIYSPRQITLAPGQAQTIRLILRKPANLEAGEYRSYLLFKALPQNAGTDIGNLEQQSDGISIQLTPIIGIAIPVIVRHGETSVSTSISGVQLQSQGNQPSLVFFVNREGNESVYGDITVSLVNGQKETVISKINGVAVYSPNPRRKFNLPLHLPNGMDGLQGKTIKIEYKKQAAEGGEIIVSDTFQLK